MKKQIGHKYRVYPTESQKRMLVDAEGCARFVYNWAIYEIKTAYKATKTSPSFNELSRRLTQMKKQPQYVFLNSVPDTVLRRSLRDCQTAYTRFFNKESGYPQYKTRTPNKSIRMQDVVYKDNILKLPKFGEIKVKWTRLVTEVPRQVTLSVDKIGRYFISFCEEQEIEPLPSTGKIVGIDVGLHYLCTFSDGTQVPNPRYLRNKQRALRRCQKALSRTQKNSKRREKKRQQLAKLHAKVSDCRRDTYHKLTTQIVTDFDLVVVEDLKIKNLMKNKHLAYSISDASWGELFRQLQYKCDLYGKQFVKVSPAYTSRDCSTCGHRHPHKMSLSIRHWTCSSCGAHHDRDVNASINILHKGI